MLPLGLDRLSHGRGNIVKDYRLTIGIDVFPELLIANPEMITPDIFLIKSVKHGLYRQIDRKVNSDEREYIEYILPQEISQDRLEAIKAFREKRSPKFMGK